jgi:hypothetical protein
MNTTTTLTTDDLNEGDIVVSKECRSELVIIHKSIKGVRFRGVPSKEATYYSILEFNRLLENCNFSFKKQQKDIDAEANIKNILAFIITEIKHTNTSLANLYCGPISTHHDDSVLLSIYDATKNRFEKEIPEFDWVALMTNKQSDLTKLFGEAGYKAIIGWCRLEG